MANFTANQVQGVFGEFKPVLDEVDVTFTVNNVQGIFGEFDAALDDAAAGVTFKSKHMATMGVGSL